jgi:anti-sigma B factor antagonist
VLTVDREDTAEGHIVCRPVGELESFTVGQFRQAVAEMASPSYLVLDLSGVTFVDSAGLGALIGSIRRTRELGGQVAVACTRPNLVRLLRSVGFDRIVIIAETVAEAFVALEGHDLGSPMVVET